MHSDSGVIFLETLDESWNGVEGGAVEGGGRFDVCLRGHVVFGPLEVAAWFYCSVLENECGRQVMTVVGLFLAQKSADRKLYTFVLLKQGHVAYMYGDWVL